MITDSWKYYYKLNEYGQSVESNLIYTPLLSPDGKTMCMHYCQNLEYQPHRIIDQSTIDFFFNREVKYLQELAQFEFTPTLYEIDYSQKKIFIEFAGETFSQIVNDTSRNIDNEIPDWKNQVFNIIRTLSKNGYHKMSLYPHCFFIADGIIKTIDYYAVVPKNDSFIERTAIESIIGQAGEYRFNQATSDGMIDFKIFFELTLTKHLKKYWRDVDFSSLYEELQNDSLEADNN